MTGLYLKPVYTNQNKFLSYDTAHATNRKLKHIIMDALNAFNTIFEKYEGFSIWQPKATHLAITTSISKLLVLPLSMDILEVQKMVKLLFRFANTSPETFTAHWDYQSATLIVCPVTKVWFAANNVLSSRWAILDKMKLGPKPKETSVKAAKKGMKSGVLNTR
mmetsp:Transcript_13659/g.14987  ORF Transcript_13659/g.14987 Transcript_13659/m.14987 type:complete len:163 (+) Transcript_13659:354-842(+)